MSAAVALDFPDSQYDADSGKFFGIDPIGFLSQDTSLYRYVKNQPLVYSDPEGFEPGDKFNTIEEAGFDAISYINDASINQNLEYSGEIIQNTDGTFTYVTPRPYEPANSEVYVGGNVVGIFHTHAAYDPRYDNESFSPDDTAIATGNAVQSFLGTPGGQIKLQQPSGNTTTLSNPLQCGPTP